MRQRHLEKGRILAAGTGSLSVTTGTAAVQRAIELDAEIQLKATTLPSASGTPVMDSTAIAHCMEHNMPILVFNFRVGGTSSAP